VLWRTASAAGLPSRLAPAKSETALNAALRARGAALQLSGSKAAEAATRSVRGLERRAWPESAQGRTQQVDAMATAQESVGRVWWSYESRRMQKRQPRRAASPSLSPTSLRKGDRGAAAACPRRRLLRTTRRLRGLTSTLARSTSWSTPGVPCGSLRLCARGGGAEAAVCACRTLWFDNPNGRQKQNSYGASLRPVYTFSTVEDFWWCALRSRRPRRGQTAARARNPRP